MIYTDYFLINEHKYVNEIRTLKRYIDVRILVCISKIYIFKLQLLRSGIFL